MEIKEELQQKLVLYQLLQRHLEELRQRAVLIENKFLEIQSTKQALKDLSEPGKEILVPLGSGCYTKSRTAQKEVLVDLGAGVVVKKGEKELQDFLKKQEQELELSSKQVQEEILAVADQINTIAQEIEKFQK